MLPTLLLLLSPGIFAAALAAFPPIARPHIPERAAAMEKVVYTFRGGSDGAHPFGTLSLASDGTLFGTTRYGGLPTQKGHGTAFELVPRGSVYARRLLHRFHGSPNGSRPAGSLLIGANGILYGTALNVVFALSPTGQRVYRESVLATFEDGPHDTPTGGLIVDGSGTLYGSTEYGGTKLQGSVFALMPTASGYANQTLYSFQGGGGNTDGSLPNGDLVEDAAGALYGTTVRGGTGRSACDDGCGTIFKLTPGPSGYAETILYNFQGASDGAHPIAGLYRDSTGALYGTASGNGVDAGTVFELTPAGSGYVERTIHAFGRGGDGVYPASSLTRGPGGSFYGTTFSGGDASCGAENGCGLVYRLTPSGSGYRETVLYRFSGGADGSKPFAGVTLVGKALFGVTVSGGDNSVQECVRRLDLGCGVVYEIPL